MAVAFTAGLTAPAPIAWTSARWCSRTIPAMAPATDDVREPADTLMTLIGLSFGDGFVLPDSAVEVAGILQDRGGRDKRSQTWRVVRCDPVQSWGVPGAPVDIMLSRSQGLQDSPASARA